MLDDRVKINNIFDSFIQATKILDKSYSQYDGLIKRDIIFDFAFEFFSELEIYLEHRDDSTDLVEEFSQYKYKKI